MRFNASFGDLTRLGGEHMGETRSDSEREMFRVYLWRLGVQYYVSGRYAFHGRLMPVAGNLLHHAIEMFLKGAITRATPTCELKKLSHSLPQLWKQFATAVARDVPPEFDSIILGLDRFERLRYPDNIVAEWNYSLRQPMASP